MNLWIKETTQVSILLLTHNNYGSSQSTLHLLKNLYHMNLNKHGKRMMMTKAMTLSTQKFKRWNLLKLNKTTGKFLCLIIQLVTMVKWIFIIFMTLTVQNQLTLQKFSHKKLKNPSQSLIIINTTIEVIKTSWKTGLNLTCKTWHKNKWSIKLILLLVSLQ